ncbi:DUF4249 domain-containing protein [Hymenobacter sp. IS2118]|uniref:DUF4249 domain-containing protein n=1 Tax=Hymenobacter sp. IS2118 TaxID=1505605 RepID=UPI00055587BC|nr:DUF4249 domain-containing protein [Hymenobacter sp. IS2118]
MTLSTLSIRLAWLWCLAMALPGCIDPYEPEAISSPPSYLVVDGFINTNGPTTIKLSRTYAIGSGTAKRPPAEGNATVTIESEAGPITRLQEGPVGTYTSPYLTLTPGRTYRLVVETQMGQYASEYVAAKTTPRIDSLPWQVQSTGVGIFINSHDDAGATQYYRWAFEETWEIIPPFQPVLEYKDGSLQRISVRYPTICWGNDLSSAIQISKTTALSKDVVANFPIRFLPILSPLLNERYSILVKQYALSKAEYEYWELLRKNTESIGSLFDPQPSQLTGNVRSLTNPGDLVLGFVGVQSETSQRIFISRAELPANWTNGTGYESCIPPDTVDTEFTSLAQAFGGGRLLPINQVPSGKKGAARFSASTLGCIDCRTRGTDVKPSFW